LMSTKDPLDPNSYFIRSFGCQMNVHDSEHIAGVLESAGYAPAPDAALAGLIVFNTCSVRQSAEDRVWGNLGSLGHKESGLPLVAVCGCMAERFGVEILRRAPAVNLVFGLDALDRLPGLLDRCADARMCDTGRFDSMDYEGLASKRGDHARAWVPVSHGCDNYCSYCVVPYVRGGHRSREPREIISEVQRLTADGVIEVTLLGQNVNAYGCDLAEEVDFAGLLARVAAVPGIMRVKFETSHPRDLSDDLLEVMARTPELCEYLHLPVQAGSDSVLEAMNRGYGRDYYLERVQRAREVVPGLVLSTDIMVGFPGESEKDFRDTVRLVEEVRFDSAYIFIYSRREETPAAKMEGELPAEVRSSRFAELSGVQNGITASSLEALEGRVLEVLVEGCARKGDLSRGRTRGNLVVLLPRSAAPAGALIDVRVVGAGRHALRGELVRITRHP